MVEISEPRTVADLGEFGLIRRITTALAPAESALVGPGDDAAVLSCPDGRVVASTDLLIENRHFRRDWSTANDIGHKAAARNFADIVAMGAQPKALLVGLASPPELELSWLDSLLAGFAEECAEVGAAVVGGDVSAADSVLLAVTALGDLQGREPVRLSGAKPGNVVAVTGRLAGRPPVTRCCREGSGHRSRWSTPTAGPSRPTRRASGPPTWERPR
jgi:thiamine-monophosphate kinase